MALPSRLAIGSLSVTAACGIVTVLAMSEQAGSASSTAVVDPGTSTVTTWVTVAPTTVPLPGEPIPDPGLVAEPVAVVEGASAPTVPPAPVGGGAAAPVSSAGGPPPEIGAPSTPTAPVPTAPAPTAPPVTAPPTTPRPTAPPATAPPPTSPPSTAPPVTITRPS